MVSYMKIIKSDIKKGYVKIETQNMDDLWYLSYIVETEDIIGSNTERKIKIGNEDDRKAKVTRKKMWLEIISEKLEFSKHSNSLRINGKIREGKQDVSAGDYHTIEINDNTILAINKKDNKFLEYQKEKLEEATKNVSTNTLICSIDRGEAVIARLKKYGYEIISNIKGDVEKKDFEENIKKEFFKEFAEKIKELVAREKFSSIVFGTVPFWSDKVKQETKSLLSDCGAKLIYSVCSSSGENGIKEMMGKDEVKNALKEERFSIESIIISELLSRISKSENAEYGLNQVKEAASIGAIEKLLITDELIMKKRENDNFNEIESIMKTVDQNNGKVIIISSEHEGGKQLDGLGGIGALLRFKV